MRLSSACACLPLLALLALPAACASGSNRPHGGPSPDWITHDELIEVQGVGNMYDVVQRLRPRWLNLRAPDRLGYDPGIVVYQDQNFLGGVDILRQIQPETFYALRWLPGSLASATLPGLHPDRPVAGAIVLYTTERGGQ